MHAELTVSLAGQVQAASIASWLQTHHNRSAVNPAKALAQRPQMVAYVSQAVGAAAFATGVVVVYLCMTGDEVLVLVYGSTIPQLKQHCAKALKVLESVPGLKVSSASASVLMANEAGTDVDLLSGERRGWWAAFQSTLLDKAISKLVAVAVNGGLAFMLFPALSTQVQSALIAMIATAIAVCIEAAYEAHSTESWRWKESK